MPHDYTSISASEVTEVTATAIETAGKIVTQVVAVGPERTLANTLLPLERIGELLGDAYGKGAFMAHVHPEKDVRDAGSEAEERLSKYGAELVFDRDLYDAVSSFAATQEAHNLDAAHSRLLEFWMRDFRRAGHGLDAADRARLEELQNRLIELQTAFAQNLVEYEDYLDLTREDLDGLPDDYIARLGKGDAPDTFRVTMAYPEYRPFMEESRRRDLREALQYKFWNRAVETNRPLLEEAVTIRDEMASLLGHDTWAHHAMEVKMAGGPENVAAFYESVIPGLQAKQAAEIEVMAGLMAADEPGARLESWDWSYYTNLQKKSDYGVDANAVAQYFPLERVVQGMFDVTGDVLGLDYKRVEDTKAWHPDVYVYDVYNRGESEPIATFYADLFPREGKYGHAAAFPIVYGRRHEDGSYVKPVAAIVANFTKPSEDGPSLLKHDEALTLWHEFGHILHFCLTTVELPRFSGYDTEWDFVEAPSQIMEHWMWQPEVLQRFAKHFQTGEAIPTELVERMVLARDLNIGMFTMRQVFLGQLDLLLHGSPGAKDLDEINRAAYAYTGLPFHEGTFFPSSFGHLMGGYDAGYYGYLWSKVYGDDMFSKFQAEGITSPEVGMRYRAEVLAAGGGRDAIDHLRAFLGREPNSDAFLANLGLS